MLAGFTQARVGADAAIELLSGLVPALVCFLAFFATLAATLNSLGGPAAWREPVHAYFLRQHSNWKLVGFERVPDGNAPQAAASLTALLSQAAR